MKNFFIITTSDHITTEEYFFPSEIKEIDLKLFKKRKKDVRYSLDSGKDIFIYTRTKMLETTRFKDVKLMKQIN